MQCDHSLESYWTLLSCGAVCFVIQCGSNFLVKPCSVIILWKAIEQNFKVVLFFLFCDVVCAVFVVEIVEVQSILPSLVEDGERDMVLLQHDIGLEWSDKSQVRYAGGAQCKMKGSTGNAVDKRSPPTSVTWVRFPYSASHVGWVCCWVSPCSEGRTWGCHSLTRKLEPHCTVKQTVPQETTAQ